MCSGSPAPAAAANSSRQSARPQRLPARCCHMHCMGLAPATPACGTSGVPQAGSRTGRQPTGEGCCPKSETLGRQHPALHSTGTTEGTRNLHGERVKEDQAGSENIGITISSWQPRADASEPIAVEVRCTRAQPHLLNWVASMQPARTTTAPSMRGTALNRAEAVQGQTMPVPSQSPAGKIQLACAGIA